MSSQDYLIKDAEFADLPALKFLVESAYRGESAKKGWTNESDLIDGARLNDGELEEVFANPDKNILIATKVSKPHEILACICLNRHNEYSEFGMFAVNPNLQATGIGKILLLAAEEYVKEIWGATIMRLSVINNRTSLIEFYQRRGYQRIEKSYKMSDHHLNPDMTIGHDLVIDVYEKLI